MIIISYDIADNKTRSRFSKMLKANGAIRLQLSVYEVTNAKRIMDNIVVKIESFSKNFTYGDSVVIFEVDSNKLIKYGSAIHRDRPIVYF